MDSPTLASRRRRGFLARCERACWWIFIRIPLVLVYSLTSWAVWVASGVCNRWRKDGPKGAVLLALVVSLYILLNWSYTVTAFVDPGSTLNPPKSSQGSQHAYDELPGGETGNASSITVKSTGGERFCKKCQARKPDRTHHCSTCRRCVLKMDHHCPWIATCVGLRNYKSFVLFTTYVTLFCWTCFGLASSDLAQEFGHFEPGRSNLSVNVVLLGILGGIFGVVMTGFTGWHYHLAMNNQTTIERLEKTRYLGTLQKSLERNNGRHENGSAESEGLMQKYGEQIRELHANAIPGVTRVEEGEERHSPDQYSRFSAPGASPANMDWRDQQRERERERYEAYLDEQDSEKMPHAFDLGWKRNLLMIFGSNPLFWPFPFGTNVGDGYQWTANPRWIQAREEARQRREVQWKEQEARERRAGWGSGPRYPVNTNTAVEEGQMEDGNYLVTSDGLASVPGRGRRSPMKADRLLGRVSQYADDVPLEHIRKASRAPVDDEDEEIMDALYNSRQRA